MMDAISDVSRASEIFSLVPPRPPLPEPLNLDELFGFDQVFSGKEQGDELKDGKYFDRSKIFINHVDSLTGKYLVQALLAKDLKVSTLDKNSCGNEVVTGIGIDSDEPSEQRKNRGNKIKQEQSSPRSKENIKNSKVERKRKKVKTENEKKFNLQSSKKLFPDKVKVDLDCILIDDKSIPFDTSKLTIAEYYDILDLESGDEKESFFKEKLYKFSGNTDKNFSLNIGSMKKTCSKEITLDYEIIGTLINDKVPEGVSEIINHPQQDPSFVEHIVRCGIIIYIVTEDKEQVPEAMLVFNSVLNYIDEMKEEEQSQFRLPMFILVSSFMTWALTKPLSLKGPGIQLMEKDYRKRKPHANYQMLYELEEQVIKAKINGEIEAAVLVCGIPYGHEELTLRHLFKSAYQLADLPIYGSSDNIVPVVHVENVAQMVVQVLKKRHDIRLPFIFAKDPSNFSAKHIIKAISEHLGTGCCQLIPEAWAFLADEITQDKYDQLSADVSLESGYPLFKRDDIQWKYDSGFGTNIRDVINEYITANNLKPLNIVLFGTSLTHTKELASELSKVYQIPYVSLVNVLNEYFVVMMEKLKQMEEGVQSGGSKNAEGDVDENRSSFSDEWIRECEESSNLMTTLEYFKKLNLKRPSDVNRLTEAQKTYIVKDKLLQDRACVNHGYIFDEFPISLNQAQLLYQTNNIQLKERDGAAAASFPDYVICLKRAHKRIEVQAKDSQELVYKGVHPSQLSETENRTEGKEDAVYEAVAEDPDDLADTSAVDESVITFLLEQNHECKFTKIDVSTGDTAEAVRAVLRFIEGETFTPEITEGKSKIINHIEDKEVESGIKDQSELKNSLTQADSFIKSKEAEEATLALRSCSLLRYLINFIYSTLTNAILQVSEVRPDDPLDFIAEYIFKNNPEGRMFQPIQSFLEESHLNHEKSLHKVDSKAPCLA